MNLSSGHVGHVGHSGQDRTREDGTGQDGTKTDGAGREGHDGTFKVDFPGNF